MTSQQFNLLYDRIMLELRATDFFLFERREAFIIFLPQPLAAAQSDCFDQLAAVLKQFLKDQYQGIGISDAVSTEQVRRGYFQAAKALSISHSTAARSPCCRYIRNTFSPFWTMTNSTAVNCFPP